MTDPAAICENCEFSVIGEELNESLRRAEYEAVCCHPKNYRRAIFLNRTCTCDRYNQADAKILENRRRAS